jgi:hypothetical protein
MKKRKKGSPVPPPPPAIASTRCKDMCSCSGRGIDRFTAPGKVAYRGVDLYGPDTTGELSFLSNMVIVFEAEADQTTETLMVKGWEWR